MSNKLAELFNHLYCCANMQINMQLLHEAEAEFNRLRIIEVQYNMIKEEIKEEIKAESKEEDYLNIITDKKDFYFRSRIY